MKNYININGKKIELSDETVKEIKSKFIKNSYKEKSGIVVGMVAYILTTDGGVSEFKIIDPNSMNAYYYSGNVFFSDKRLKRKEIRG